jgi:hypothetical protein
MWDSVLIFTAKHPFSSSLCPSLFGITLIIFRKENSLRIIGYLSLFAGVVIFSILHFRWDSFSVHFSSFGSQSIVDNLDILFIGDSITCEGARPRGFITKIESSLKCDLQIICQKGAKSHEIIKLLNSSSFKFEPTLVVAQSGINDLINGHENSEVLTSQRFFLNKLESKFPKSKIMFLPVHPIITRDGLISKPPILPISNFHVWWKDPALFKNHFLMNDGVHLNAKAHTLLAKNIKNKIFLKNPNYTSSLNQFERKH